MRISQLAASSGLPVPTVKFYLREGLLHDGRLSSPTQATYDETHVTRLRLIRALVESAGLSLGEVRGVLETMDSPPQAAHDLLGVAHSAVTPRTPEGTDVSRARDLVRRLHWNVDECAPDSLAALERALEGMRAADFEVSPEAMEHYGEAMMGLARTEVAGVPTDSAESAARYVVLGTVLLEPVLLALRRLAQQSASAESFGTGVAP